MRQSRIRNPCYSVGCEGCVKFCLLHKTIKSIMSGSSNSRYLSWLMGSHRFGLYHFPGRTKPLKILETSSLSFIECTSERGPSQRRWVTDECILLAYVTMKDVISLEWKAYQTENLPRTGYYRNAVCVVPLIENTRDTMWYLMGLKVALVYGVEDSSVGKHIQPPYVKPMWWQILTALLKNSVLRQPYKWSLPCFTPVKRVLIVNQSPANVTTVLDTRNRSTLTSRALTKLQTV